VKKAAAGLLIALFALTVLVPFLWVLMNSFKQGHQILAAPWDLPSPWHPVNYSNAWEKANIGRYFVNSLLVSALTLAVLIPVGAMAAYVFARYPFKGSTLLFGAFLGGMMFPQFLTIVPLFLLITDLGLFDTKTGLVLVYIAFSLPFTVFVLTGFFQTLPKEMAEAAMIDGCGHARTFWKVMLPLAKPGIAVVGIFNAIGLWNEYNLALVLLSQEENFTLPRGIANLVMTQQYQSDWGALFAGLVIVMVPVLFVYWLFRERIHDTMLAGALKG
jgi:N-acetylglucosamine transport system permease protein